MRPEKSYGIHHRVTLPDGREVEVVYLDRTGGDAGAIGEEAGMTGGDAGAIGSDASAIGGDAGAIGSDASVIGGDASAIGGGTGVRSDHARENRRGEASGLADAPPLHVCFHCDGQLVHPVDWSDEGGGSWRILLRCPECEATREGVFDRDEVDSFEEELDRGMGSLLSDLRRMTHTNMSEEIDFFVRALQADVILPSDF